MYPLKVVVVGVGGETLETLQRELDTAGTIIEGHYRDMPTAVDQLRGSRDDQRLFVVQIGSTSEAVQLKKLNHLFPGRPILVLAELAAGDSWDILAANRAGACQLVPLPLEAEDLRDALQCVPVQFNCAAAESRVIAVSGTTGGCGATTLAINLAHEIASQHNQRTVLVELALQMGVLATYLDIEPRVTTHDLLHEGKRLDLYVVQQALVKVDEKFSILAGPHKAIAPLNVSAREVLRLVQFAKALADVVVLDVPCSYNDLHFQTLGAADQIVLVGEQKVPSIRAIKMVRDTLPRDKAPEQHIVLNRYDPRAAGLAAADLEKHLGVPRVLTVADDAAAVTAAVNQGQSLRQHAPSSPVLAGVGALARILLGKNDTAAASPQRAGLFGRLAHVFSK